MPLSDEQLLTLARRHQSRLIGLAGRTSTAVDRAWLAYGGLTDAAQAAFVGAVSPIVEQSMTVAAQMTSAYLVEYSGATGFPAVPIQLAPAVYRGGVTVAEVYARPTVLARVAVSNGVSFVSAMAAGRGRATQLADTDTMLAARTAANDIMGRLPHVVGSRRVPDANACPFCIMAATNRYGVGQLMPIHPNCHCIQVMIMASKLPGRKVGHGRQAVTIPGGTAREIEHRAKVSVAQGYQDKAKYWREQSSITTDQQAETRYAKRADAWDAKATARLAQGSPPVKFSVVDHPELGPTLQAA